MDTPELKKYFLRFLIAFFLAFLFGFVVSEVSFRLNTEENLRESEIFELVIPKGTAERVKNGFPSPSIPEEMVFYSGDQIVVKNEDLVSHQLGPIWVPAGASGQLALEKPQKYSLACSFQPSQIMGIEIRSKVTNQLRFQGIAMIGFPTGVLLGLFSIILYPIHPDHPKEVTQNEKR